MEKNQNSGMRMLLRAPAPAGEMAKSKAMQDGAGAGRDAQEHEDADTGLYVLSVDEVRTRLLAKDIKKSPDTIQRYCRNGELDCQKLGIFRRYFVTEASVEQLEEKLQLDAGAGACTQIATPVSPGVQVRETDPPGIVQENTDPRAGAGNGIQTDEGAKSELAEAVQPVKAAVLEAKLDAMQGLNEQLKEENKFLKEEVREARTQRRDVTAISERMLGTLETLAVGGRLVGKDPQPPTPPKPVPVDVIIDK